jgi:hypothetical protein
VVRFLGGCEAEGRENHKVARPFRMGAWQAMAY